MNQDAIDTYLNPVKNSEQAFLFVGELQQLCENARDANNTNHFHDYYSIYLLKTGNIKYITTHIKDTISTPGLLFIGPGINHRMEIPMDVQGYSIIFNDAFINIESSPFFNDLSFFSDDQIYAVLPIKDIIATEFEDLIRMMQNDHHGHLNGNGLLLKNYLNVFLLKAQQWQLSSPLHSGNAIPSSHHKTLLQFKKMVNEQYINNRQVGDYANQLNIQADCLNEVTKSLSGLTASELIRNKVLNEAKKLLYTTSLNLKEIAWKLGFEDSAYFSRYFKKYTGQTLKEFKNQIQEMSK